MQPRPTRVFTTSEVLSGRLSLQGYPFRHIYIVLPASAVFGGAFSWSKGNEGMVDQLLSAVEVVESQGWELVCIGQDGRMACMRRIDHR
ncbi:MAG: hypothetical protein JXA67_20590 [Micromonosporaceae bacterium]|nr:hypothetical protein [Micromonosporaceae bacterium]